ncbi:MAG: flagellar hook-length control protein FliK [Nitrospiraceae bacterium]
MQKATDSADSNNTESPLPQTETDDHSSVSKSNLSTTSQQETASSSDTESQAPQTETEDGSSSTTSGSDPLLTSLVGATLVAPPSQADTTPVALGSDLPTVDVDGHSVVSESLISQPAIQPAEKGLGLVSSDNRTEVPAVQPQASAMGDILAKVSQSASEVTTGREHLDVSATSVEPSDIGAPLTAQQVQKIESPVLAQGFPIKEQQESEATQPPVPSTPMASHGQELVQQAATMTTKQAGQKGEEVAAESDWSPEQQVPGNGELSLRQQHREAASSVTQAAAAASEHMQTEEQGANPEAGGQKKDERLKWLSHIDLQSTEVSSPIPESRMSESVEGGTQYSSYQQGQGGTPQNIKSAQASSVPVPPQTNPLSPDAEPAPVPRTQAVQFDLSPVDFGQLRVRVVLSDHTIHTHMSTDRAELGQMLTGQQEQLSSQLSTAGLDLGRFQVHVDQDRTNQSGQDWQSQAHQGPSQQRRESRSQDSPQEAPVPSAPRTGILSYFA